MAYTVKNNCIISYLGYVELITIKAIGVNLE